MRWAIYPVFFLLVLMISVYVSFSGQNLRAAIENLLTNKLFEMSKKRGTPSVLVTSASLWPVLNVKAENVKVLWPAHEEDPSVNLVFKSLKLGLGFWPLIFGQKNVHFQSNLYDGDLKGSFNINKTDQISALSLDIKNLDFEKMAFIEPLWGILMGGVLELSSKFSSKNDLRKDGEGKLNLVWKNWQVGPGNMKIPGASFMGAIKVPKVLLGDLKSQMLLSKSEFTTQTFGFTGGDIEGELNLTVNIGPSINTSKLSGSGWFKTKPEFLKANNTIKMLFEVLPELRASLTSADNKVNFLLAGTLGQPRFSFKR